MFNSLKYAKILEGFGLPRNQAETHIQILSDVIGEEMVTKEDISEEDVRRLESDISSLKSHMSYEFQALEYRMTLKLGGLMAAIMASGLTAAKLLLI